jgi:hypothetical protein
MVLMMRCGVRPEFPAGSTRALRELGASGRRRYRGSSTAAVWAGAEEMRSSDLVGGRLPRLLGLRGGAMSLTNGSFVVGVAGDFVSAFPDVTSLWAFRRDFDGRAGLSSFSRSSASWILTASSFFLA